jgi:hypothetical protein
VTGALIIGALLEADGALVAVVPPENMKAGRLSETATLPALLVRVVSGTEQHPLKRSGWERRTDRVAVLARSQSYREKGHLIGLVRDCCSGRTGDIGGGIRVSILTAGLGPDVDGPGNTFEQTQDFRVSYDAPV